MGALRKDPEIEGQALDGLEKGLEPCAISAQRSAGKWTSVLGPSDPAR